jgi:hypothetical protein
MRTPPALILVVAGIVGAALAQVATSPPSPCARPPVRHLSPPHSKRFARITMTRRTLLAALASATLVPTSRLLAAATTTGQKPDAPTADADLAATITALERASWAAFKACDVEAWSALYADTFFELLADASFWTKAQVLDDIRSHAWETHSYTMSEIRVVPMNETAALITYKIDASFTWHTKDEATGQPVDKPYTTNAYATCAYAKVDGRWQGFIYQETGMLAKEPAAV